MIVVPEAPRPRAGALCRSGDRQAMRRQPRPCCVAKLSNELNLLLCRGQFIFCTETNGAFPNGGSDGLRIADVFVQQHSVLNELREIDRNAVAAFCNDPTSICHPDGMAL